MSASSASLTILRSAAVLGNPVHVGSEPMAEVVRAPVAMTARSPQVDPFEEGYAAGFLKGRDEGFEQGHAEGLLAGKSEGLAGARGQIDAGIEEARQQVEAEAARHRERLVDAASALAQVREQLLAGADEELSCLALELACKVLGPSLASAEGVRAQVGLVIGASHGPLTVHVHPGIEAELGQLPCEPSIQWVPDEQVGLGGALVQHGATTIDARLETILRNFKAVLLRSAHVALARGGEEGMP